MNTSLPVVKTRRLCLLHSSIVLLLLLLAAGAANARQSAFTLQSARGRVELQTGGKGVWKNIGRGSHEAAVGDHLRTGPNSGLTIITDDGTRIAVGAKTEIVLREPNRPRGWRVIIGKLFASHTDARRLEVRTPSAIAAAEGTAFQVDVSEDGTTVLTVVEGKVQFYNNLGSVAVLDSQQSTARVGQAPTRPVVIDPKSLTAWETTLQSLVVNPPDFPFVSGNPDELDRALAQRQQAAAEPPQAAVQVALAEVLLDLHRTEEATAHAQRAVELAPSEGSSHGLLGYALWQAGRPEEANEQFAVASQASPGDVRWPLGRALIALGKDDTETAIQLLQEVGKSAPHDPLPRAYLAGAYLRAGDLGKANSAALEATSLGPDSSVANIYLAYVYLAQGKLEESVAAAGQAVEVAPRSAFAHEALGSALTFAGDLSKARVELDQAVALNPGLAGPHLALARLLAAQSEIEPALQEAQLAVGLDPHSAPGRSTLGLLFLLNKDPQRAGREFQQALQANPSLADAHTGWGQVLLKRGRFREALEQQKTALSLDTDSASAQNNLGGVYASLGRMQEANEHLTRAIELQPGWGMPYANLALLYLEQNRFREALDAGERAVALGEQSAFTHTVLARIYMRQGRTDRALSELRQAVAIDDQYPQAHFQLARLYLGQNRSRDAVREILSSVTTDPSAMLETRRYARTENTLSGGSFDQIHYDLRHSNQASDGRLSYFVSGLTESSDGFRRVNQDESQKFLETIVGHQSSPNQQLVFFGTLFRNDKGLPGPATSGSPGDSDDRQKFTGSQALLALRQRLNPKITGTLKYSFNQSDFLFRNPDSLTLDDINQFIRLTNRSSQQSPELRLDAVIGERSSLSLGYAHLQDRIKEGGMVQFFDDIAGEFFPYPLDAAHTSVLTDTAWLEAQTRFSNRFSLTLGAQWGRESDVTSTLLPKVVAVYRPEPSTWWSFVINPVFRADAAELAPVEALADPKGLSFLNFAGSGQGQTYELRYQRQGGRSSTLTTALAYQLVRKLLIDVEDPALTGLPSRLLLGRGHRWIADAAYERWLTDNITGRVWAQWQTSRGRFPEVMVNDTDWPYTPEWQAGGRLDYINSKGLRIGLEAVNVGSRFHDAENTQRVGSYFLLNLRTQYQRNLRENYFISIMNLAGRHYETFNGFPQAGRAVFAGLEYRY